MRTAFRMSVGEGQEAEYERRHMREIMPDNADDSPVSRPLVEVFPL